MAGMKKFAVNMTRMYAAYMEVEADSEEEAESLAKHKLEFGDVSDIEWEPINRSIVIEEVYET